MYDNAFISINDKVLCCMNECHKNSSSSIKKIAILLVISISYTYWKNWILIWKLCNYIRLIFPVCQHNEKFNILIKNRNKIRSLSRFKRFYFL